MTLVEAAVETIEAAQASERTGADRIELCVGLDEGGTTPGVELLKDVIGSVNTPVFVLIRPRPGNFVYAPREIDTMRRHIDAANSSGALGVVTGALTADGHIEVDQMRRLIESAGALPLTFHRAFDLTADAPGALEQLVDLGVDRILTSGGAPTALEGAENLARLVEQSDGRLVVVAGGGIREHNVRDVVGRTHVGEVHTRFTDEARLRRLIKQARGSDG
ncbi:MAG: copper homeostasis protein CutC [Gemmatimonadaceae bacterium]